MHPADLVASRRRPILAVGASIIVLWCVTLFAWYAFLPMLKSDVQAYAVEMLRAQFASDVHFNRFQVSFFPRLRVTAYGLRIGQPSSPLIEVGIADAESDLVPWHVRSLVIEGFAVHLPTGPLPAANAPKPFLPLRIDDLVANRGQLEILPSTPEVAPMRLQVASLHMQHFQPGHPADFSGVLLTSEPRAEIQADGRLGSWNAQNPSLTSVQGKYSTMRCDLASLPGLQGSLSSQGHFQGDLARVEITGDASASRFGLAVSGRPESVHANFQIAMDAANGSAALEHIDGELEQTAFTASGHVENMQDDSARNIAFEVAIRHGRLEDLLPLAVKSATSPIRGALAMHGNVSIFPGDDDIMNRLRVQGDFTAPNGHFASLDLREQLRKLSRKAEGRPNDAAAGSSVVHMQGHVQLEDGVAEFSNLGIALEDAWARLDGSYRLANQALDLEGELWLAVKLSKTATGPKALLLKAADPFFRGKRGGSRLPIRITGFESDPHFQLDLGRKSLSARSHARRMVFSH